MGARLTPEDREAIVAAYGQGEPIEDIANRFGVSRTYPAQLARAAGLPRRREQREGRAWIRANRIGAVRA